MNDKELDRLLNKVADHYEDEFDLEGGLARLRAAGHGFSERRRADENEDEDFPAAPATTGRRTVSALTAKTDVDEAIAVLEGVLVSEDVAQIDLTKLEGAPSQRAYVVFDRRPATAGVAAEADATAPERSTLRDVVTSPLWLVMFAATFAALVVTLIALVLDVSGYGGFTAATVTLLVVLHRGSQLMIRQPKLKKSRRPRQKRT